MIGYYAVKESFSCGLRLLENKSSTNTRILQAILQKNALNEYENLLNIVLNPCQAGRESSAGFRGAARGAGLRALFSRVYLGESQFVKCKLGSDLAGVLFIIRFALGQ